MNFIAVMLIVLSTMPAWAGDLAITESYYRDTNASLHLMLVNNGKAPITILPPVVNGTDTASLGRDGLHITNVLFYRCRPNPILTGAKADMLIALAVPTDKPATVELRSSTGERLTRVIPCVPEKLTFQAIRFSRDLRSVDLYVRWSDSTRADALKTIRMDGARMSKHMSPWPARNLDGLAYARITLSKPLDKNSYHMFEVETDAGLSTAYQIRAIPAEFLIGVYGSPSEESVRDWAAHGCNHYLSFGAVNPDQLDLMNAQGISVGAKYIPQVLVDRTAGKVVPMDETAARKALRDVMPKSSLLYHHLVDEPDVSDHYVSRTLGGSGMELIARGELSEKEDPGRYTFVQLDNTFRPNNYRVYGESADVLATHRYSLGNFVHSEAGAQTFGRLLFFDDMTDTLIRFRQATEPKPFFMVSQFFDLGPGRSGRPPTVDEMRIQCYAMVAGGARGIIHYIHSGSGGGHEGGKTKALWDGMTGLHAELMRMGDIAGMGGPAPASWATTDSPHIISSLILAGDSMAVVLINRSHRSGLEQFTARPVQNVKVTVRIPPWMKTTGFEVIAADTGEAIPAHMDAGIVSFTVSKVEVARGFLIQPKD